MPLIDLQTDYRNLKFGNDRPGGGNSGLPYITFPIEDIGINQQFKKYYTINRTGLDFPIRGGSLEQLAGANPTTPSSNIDFERIKKFLNDKPRGDIFLAKQAGLQLSNPRSQTGDSIFTLQNNRTPGVIPNTQVYNNGMNTLAQIKASGTGLHATRIGTVPFAPLLNLYKDVVGAELKMTNQEVLNNNRLLILANLKLQTKTSANTANSNSYLSAINTINKLGISLNRDLIYQYLGGPGSTYGVGSTIVRRSDDTTQAAEYKFISGLKISDTVMTYDRIMAQQKRSLPNVAGIIDSYEDYRDQTPSPNKMPGGENWSDVETTQNIIVGFGIDGVPITEPASVFIQNSKNRIDYKFYKDKSRIDRMNALGPINIDSDSNPFNQPKINNQILQEVEDTKDIIKFAFECVQNDSTKASTILFFRAYLSSITDNNSATWNPFKYMGRGENFYTYQGFDRTIGFSFKIGIGSREELDSTYEKLNYLISQVYPDYSQFTQFMTSPIIRLTIGDYIYRLFGFLESVNVTIDQNSSWEIDDGSQLPHFLDVSVSFKPILSQLPQRSVGGVNRASIIRQTDSTYPSPTIDLVQNNPTLDPQQGASAQSTAAASPTNAVAEAAQNAVNNPAAPASTSEKAEAKAAKANKKTPKKSKNTKPKPAVSKKPTPQPPKPVYTPGGFPTQTPQIPPNLRGSVIPRQ
jgi:hypothetical protein